MFYDYYGLPAKNLHCAIPSTLAHPERLLKSLRCLVTLAYQPASTESWLRPWSFHSLADDVPTGRFPTLQLSLIRGLDPERHQQLGEALRPLLDENVLVIGSGFTP